MVASARKAVFLDRDGVIIRSILRNGKPHAPTTLEDFALLPDVDTAIRDLAAAGFLILVVTNQPDIGNGLVALEIVEEMHRKLMQVLPIDKIYMCPHGQKEGCACRKPKPGMLLAAKDEFGIDLAASFMVGDRYSDVQAAIAAGCIPVFIDNDYVETPDFNVNMRAGSLLEASRYILGKI